MYRLNKVKGFVVQASAPFTAGESAAEVQSQLESRLYGSENVSVSGGPEGATSRYRVTFVGELEDQTIRPMEAEASGSAAKFAVKVSVNEVVQGHPDGVIVVNAANLGDADVSPQGQPVTIADTLPRGLKAVAIEGSASEDLEHLTLSGENPLACSLQSVSCTYTGVPPAEYTETSSFAKYYPTAIVPYYQIQVRIAVDLKRGARSGEVNEAGVTGGGAPTAAVGGRWS